MSRRAYDTDREAMLVAYEMVTPPRTPWQDEMRERLFEVVRAIRGQTLLRAEAAARVVPRTVARGRQLAIPGTE